MYSKFNMPSTITQLHISNAICIRIWELEAQRVLGLFINGLNLLEVAGILTNSQCFVLYARVGCVTHHTQQQYYVLDIQEDLFNTKQFFCLMLYNRKTAEHFTIILAAITVTGLSINNERSISQICWYFPTWTVLFFIRYCLAEGFWGGLLFLLIKKFAIQWFAIGSLLFLEETPLKQTIY